MDTLLLLALTAYSPAGLPVQAGPQTATAPAVSEEAVPTRAAPDRGGLVGRLRGLFHRHASAWSRDAASEEVENDTEIMPEDGVVPARWTTTQEPPLADGPAR